MPVTDPGVAALGHPERIAGLIGDEGIEVVLYERSRVEPTLGGGSAMDTAKVAELRWTYGAMPERHHRVGARRRYPQAAALLIIAAKEPSPVDLKAIVRESMHNW